MERLVILVHGWSVTTTATYGGLAGALEATAKSQGLDIDVRNIYLSRYVSFKDEIRLEDISRAFEAAIRRELRSDLTAGRQFLCITHSTGGPVIRDWVTRHYTNLSKPCPLSHLIMLAPANFGSALAQLGKSRLSRMKTWFNGVEPGDRVLDWLELGSGASMELNKTWMENACFVEYKNGPIFSFVISGDAIDRKLYDHVNPYTGEIGSDGVVRLAAANLNSTYLRLEQIPPLFSTPKSRISTAKALEVNEVISVSSIAFKILHGFSHSGEDMGIMRSIGAKDPDHPTLRAISDCIAVETVSEYQHIRDKFQKENSELQTDVSKVIEIERVPVLPDRIYIHDPQAMVIFRFSDHCGEPVSDLDLKLTAGARNSPNELPKDFLSDVQRNRKAPNTLTFLLNYSVMEGCDALVLDGKQFRQKLVGAENYGINIDPFSTAGYVHYLPCKYSNKASDLLAYIKPNETTIIDIVLNRVVTSGVFQLTRDRSARTFKDQDTGTPV